MDAGTREGRPRPATMKDVATTAGVSVQTVSNLVNGRFGEMNAATRERVETAMRDLGYHRNHTARGLRSSMLRTLAFMVLDEHERFLADPLTDLLLAGIGDSARSRNFGILVQAARPGSRPEELLAPVLERRVDGGFVLLSGPPAERRRYVDALEAHAAPFVVFDESIRRKSVMSVRAAERKGARRLTEHLIARGHRRVAFVAAKVPWAVVEQRHLGYRDALGAAGIDPAPELERFEAGWEPEGALPIVDALLDAPDGPTAIMCGSDLLAVAAMHAIRRRHLTVPDDVAVTGFDDFPFARFVDPALTTVAVPAYEMGRAAASMLIDEIEGEGVQRRQALFEVELRLRDSG